MKQLKYIKIWIIALALLSPSVSLAITFDTFVDGGFSASVPAGTPKTFTINPGDNAVNPIGFVGIYGTGDNIAAVDWAGVSTTLVNSQVFTAPQAGQIGALYFITGIPTSSQTVTIHTNATIGVYGTAWTYANAKQTQASGTDMISVQNQATLDIVAVTTTPSAAHSWMTMSVRNNAGASCSATTAGSIERLDPNPNGAGIVDSGDEILSTPYTLRVNCNGSGANVIGLNGAAFATFVTSTPVVANPRQIKGAGISR